ncbi:MAG: hypothetical protein HZB13_10820, partial [Acidobacteria bacterium]|nr:hypothetical protein [Acidobacteriota bacterium]
MYARLRAASLAESYIVEELTLKRDCGTIRLKEGIISFAGPQLGKVTLGVFTGSGEFRLEPVSPIEKTYLKRVSGAETVNEPFARAVFVFTDGTYDEVRKSAKTGAQDPKAAEALQQYRSRVRRRNDIPRSMSEAMLTSESMDNMEAEVLAGLYNPARPPAFNLFIRGQKRSDMRFFVRGLGALPDMPSPEEVALINVDSEETADGIWYHSHLREELLGNAAAIATEDKRPVQAEKYMIETMVEGSRKLTGTAKVELSARIVGERVIKFGLLQDLRVNWVTDAAGQQVPFIQEDKKEDGSFYVVLPQGLKKDERVTLTINYSGNKVLEDAGGGNLYVGARTSWYPSLNSFLDRIPYDLTFKAAKRFTVVASGRKVKEWREGDLTCSQWQSEAPHAVAGFNMGVYKLKEAMEAKTQTQVEAYAATELPGYLYGAEGTTNISPAALLNRAISETQASIQVYTNWFGGLPYKRLAVTQQPEFSMGQSWPELVYLPLSAFLDSTTRVRILGGINNKLTDFVDEVTAHEVAHQWWGHLVGWETYRDQWLSEGLATFSSSLYLQAIDRNPARFLSFWEKARKSLLEKNAFGVRSIDAGPVTLGWRVSTKKSGAAYQDLTYLKGGYVVHMLRMMMMDGKTGDTDFAAMMKDFVESHKHKNASLDS